MNTSKWIKRNTSSLAGKTVAISGATGGIGRELCAYLSELGASLVLLDRNIEKSKKLAEELKARFPLLLVSHIRVDMEDIASVKTAADKLRELQIDYLILNAGAYSIPRHKCDTGYDNVFQINFVSPYYIIKELLPTLGIPTIIARTVRLAPLLSHFSRRSFSSSRNAGSN